MKLNSLVVSRPYLAEAIWLNHNWLILMEMVFRPLTAWQMHSHAIAQGINTNALLWHIQNIKLIEII
jgi:hypothetical protein